MKEVIIDYFVLLRGNYEILESGTEAEIKKLNMPSLNTFKVEILKSLVSKQTSDQHVIDEVTCLIIYDLIANYVILPAQRVENSEPK